MIGRFTFIDRMNWKKEGGKLSVLPLEEIHSSQKKKKKRSSLSARS